MPAVLEYNWQRMRSGATSQLWWQPPPACKRATTFTLIDDDDGLVTSGWAIGSTGQLNRITEILGNVITLLNPLRRDFSANNSGLLAHYEPIQNVGIEDLRIERVDTSFLQHSNIRFSYATNCWVTCVESHRCHFAHVELSNSSHIEISGSYFHEAFHYGNGGKAYGVMMHFASGDNLVYDCIFRKLRHAMILQAGANGNVFAYNYSTEPFWTEVSLPEDSAGDAVLHGNYPYANLWEGNICQNMVIDNSHGINGPLNTFFRNRVAHYGIFMNFDPATDQQNFIGNELTGPDSLGFYLLFGEDHYEQANNHQGEMKPDTSLIPDENTLFLDTIPSNLASAWPPIGFPNELGTHSIPAKDRYDMAIPTTCELEALTSIPQPPPKGRKTWVAPNPVKDVLQLLSTGNWLEEEDIYWQVFSVDGKLLLKQNGGTRLVVNSLPSGVYWLRWWSTRMRPQATAFVKY